MGGNTKIKNNKKITINRRYIHGFDSIWEGEEDQAGVVDDGETPQYAWGEIILKNIFQKIFIIKKIKIYYIKKYIKEY